MSPFDVLPACCHSRVPSALAPTWGDPRASLRALLAWGQPTHFQGSPLFLKPSLFTTFPVSWVEGSVQSSLACGGPCGRAERKPDVGKPDPSLRFTVGRGSRWQCWETEKERPLGSMGSREKEKCQKARPPVQGCHVPRPGGPCQAGGGGLGVLPRSAHKF